MKNILSLVSFALLMVQLQATTPIVKKRTYTVDLQHLCPQVPSTTAEHCTKAFNVSNYFSQLYTADEAMALDGNPDELPEKWLSLVKCQTDKIGTPEVSLEVYCYFKGLKESYNKLVLNLKSDDARQKSLLKLDQEIATTTNDTFRNELKDIRQKLVVAFSDLDQTGLVVNAATTGN